jgi:hypothetical protein
LKALKKADLFFYNPLKCISTGAYKSNKPILKIKPRDDPLFMQGVDNLTPVKSKS